MHCELVFWENVWRLFFNFNLHTQAQSHHESLLIQIFGVCTVSFGQEILSNFCATVVIFQKKKTATSAVPKWELALWSNWKTYSFHDPQWSIAHRFPRSSMIDCSSISNGIDFDRLTNSSIAYAGIIIMLLPCMSTLACPSLLYQDLTVIIWILHAWN